jgi:hypothetical protein
VLAGRQPGFHEVAFEPAPAALGNLMFGQSRQEAFASAIVSQRQQPDHDAALSPARVWHMSLAKQPTPSSE